MAKSSNTTTKTVVSTKKVSSKIVNTIAPILKVNRAKKVNPIVNNSGEKKMDTIINQFHESDLDCRNAFDGKY